MSSQLFHDYRIQHAYTNTNSQCSPNQSILSQQLFQKEQNIKTVDDRLCSNLNLLTQYFAQNPVQQLKQSPPQETDREQQNQFFVNLSSFKKKEPSPRPINSQLLTLMQGQQHFKKPTIKIVNSQTCLEVDKENKHNENIRLKLESLGSQVLSTKRSIVTSTKGSQSQTRRQFGWLDMNVVERNEKWSQIKKEKNKALQEIKQQDEMQECTFQPVLRSGSKNHGSKIKLNRSEACGSVMQTRSPINSLSQYMHNQAFARRPIISEAISSNISRNNNYFYASTKRESPMLSKKTTYSDLFKVKQSYSKSRECGYE